MKELGIDIETYSSRDLAKCGVYKYVEAPDFTILLFAYSVDNGPVSCVDFAQGEELPDEIYNALIDPDVIKTAWNAAFERVCLSKYFGLSKPFDPAQWKCTMVRAARMGLPLSLGQCGEVLKLADGKMAEGKTLIRFFSMPGRNGVRHLPSAAPDRWETFKKYCARDVDVEQALLAKLRRLEPAPFDEELYIADQEINDRGVLIDRELVDNAMRFDMEYKSELLEEMRSITGLENPNSVTQLKSWLNENTGLGLLPSLSKANLNDIEDALTYWPKARRVMALRREMAKTSNKKYEAMQTCVCDDGRIHGLLQFCGAARTGRWCLTGDHEVLTLNGWTRLSDWQGCKIACWSPATESVSFQDAKALAFPYDGEMIHINSQRCEQISTPDHKMPYWTKQGWGSTEIKNLCKRFKMPFTGFVQSTPGIDSDALRVIIMTQADGHYTDTGSVRYHFSKMRKCERCKRLLRRAGIVFSEQSNTNGTTTFTVKKRDLPLYLRMFRNKVFGYWMLSENADTIFDELEYWDAYRCGPNSIQYTSVIKQNVDVIQALAHLSGRACTVVVKERQSENKKWSAAYVANIWLSPGRHTEIREEFIRSDFYRGTVYCAETKTGFFLVRRMGKVWITGNSGRLVQCQNLPQNHLADLDYARTLVKVGDLEEFEMNYANVTQVLSELIRTAFIASPGHILHVCDFSAIEARVIAWIAGENWVLDVFRKGGDIYCATASRMFGVPVEKHGPNAHLRAKGKISVLALGYGGGVSALEAMGGSKLGLTEREEKETVRQWREANPHIVRFWAIVEKAAFTAIKTGNTVTIHRGITVGFRWGMLLITLPSGRTICYPRARVSMEYDDGWRGDHEIIEYEGLNQVTKKWETLRTYGGKLTENIVQAT
ncbi:MAG: hypothetical protein K2L95_05230, partial [Alphaproteobacteria bacterium]|nr:hypothetical protein [Alphaproteobacteria bacterium]